MTKNVDADKYRYNGYGFEFDARSTFLLKDYSSFGINFIIFGVSNSVSVHVTIKKKDILILKKGPTDGLGDAKLTTNIEYFINFTEQQRNFA